MNDIYGFAMLKFYIERVIIYKNNKNTKKC